MKPASPELKADRERDYRKHDNLQHYRIRSKEGIDLWEGDYPSLVYALRAYRKDLGNEASYYDDANPHWMDDLEIEATYT